MILSLQLGFVHGLSWASEGYVTDSINIMLRTEPDSEARIISVLSSGDPLEILEARRDWSRVRFQGPDGSPKDGWVLSRFIMDREPWEGRVKILEEENTSLKEALSQGERKWSQLTQGEQQLQEKLQAAEDMNRKLSVENEVLRVSQKVKWFGIGALVMFGGWVFGLITGRLQRKRPPSVYTFGR
jgi:SH3 domain protein